MVDCGRLHTQNALYVLRVHSVGLDHARPHDFGDRFDGIQELTCFPEQEVLVIISEQDHGINPLLIPFLPMYSLADRAICSPSSSRPGMPGYTLEGHSQDTDSRSGQKKLMNKLPGMSC